MFIFVREKELERDPEVMRGRKLVEARFAVLSGIYPDFYGWKYYYFAAFLWIIHPGLYTYFLIVYFISFNSALQYMDIELLGQVLCLGTVTIIYCLVSINYIANKTEVDELMKLLGRGLIDYSRPMTEKEKSVMESKFRYTHTYAIGSAIMLTVISATHMGLLPIIRGGKGMYTSITNGSVPINKYSPLPIWTPYECNSLGTFLVSYFTQLIPGCMEGSIINACCILFVGLSQQLSGNLEVLTISIRDLPARALHMFENEGGLPQKDWDHLYKDEHFLKCLNVCMRENVQHHNRIIEFYNKFQKVVGFSILAIFSGTGLFISAAAYSLLVISESGGDAELLYTNLFVWGFYLFMYTFLLTIYCINGQEVTDRNAKILRALYDTPWLEADMAFRRSVHIAMSYAQASMELTAMGIVSSSYETLLDIIKTSFSYLNMLMVARD